MSNDTKPRRRPLIELSDILGVMLLLSCLPWDNGFLNNLVAALYLPKTVVVLAIVVIALQVFLIDARIRHFWLEFEFVSLCLFGVALWLVTSPAQSTQTNIPQDVIDATFTLPADKIESDLANLRNLQADIVSSSKKETALSVLLLLVSEHETQSYTVQLNDIQGVSNTDHNPPYNKDAVKVHVSLLRGMNGDTAISFAKQLMNVTAIYLLPLAAAPTPASSSLTQNPTFILPNKIASDLSILQDNEKIVLLLEVDHQVYQYPATLDQIRDKDGLVLHTPFANERADNVSVRLTQNAEEVIDDFIIQLSNVTAIYLLPAQNGK